MRIRTVWRLWLLGCLLFGLATDLAAAETSPALRVLVERFLAEHPKNKYGLHTYSAADYGLEVQAIRDEFADYIETFDVVTT